VLKEDSRRSKMSTVPARMAKGRGDRFGSSMTEIARHVRKAELLEEIKKVRNGKVKS
jgi:hypothetical protein